MKRSVWSVFVYYLLGSTCCACFSQQPGTPQALPSRQTDTTQSGSSTYSFKAASQLVVLDVVVRDRNGHIVTSLGKDDFTVYEDKVPQKLVSVDLPNAGQPASARVREAAINSTAELDKAEPDAPVSIIVLDELNTRFEDEAFTRYSLKKYLATQGDMLLQPTMLVAVNPSRFLVLRDYTTSKTEILSALERHLAGIPWKATDSSWRGERFNAAFASLIEVAEATSGHPGHKNMIWIGRGFPTVNPLTLTPTEADGLKSVLATCTELLRRARITLYAIDPTGLSVQPAAQDTDGFYLEDPFGVQVDFRTMAQATGGKAFFGRNDVDTLIEESVRGGIDFFTLAYRPAELHQTEKPFRNIRVVPKDPSLTASTRLGYYADPPATAPDLTASGKYSSQMVFDLATAASSLMVYDGLPLTITRDPQTPDTFRLGIAGSAIPWKTVDQSHRQAELTLYLESFDRKGKVLSTRAKLYTVNSTSAADDPRPVVLAETISTQLPAARLRFIVRANDTQKVGADNFFLVDPGTLSLSTTGLIHSKHE